MMDTLERKESPTNGLLHYQSMLSYIETPVMPTWVIGSIDETIAMGHSCAPLPQSIVLSFLAKWVGGWLMFDIVFCTARPAAKAPGLTLAGDEFLATEFAVLMNGFLSVARPFVKPLAVFFYEACHLVSYAISSIIHHTPAYSKEATGMLLLS